MPNENPNVTVIETVTETAQAAEGTPVAEATQATTELVAETATPAEKPVAKATPAPAPKKRVQGTKTLFDALKSRVWGKGEALTSLFRARGTVQVDGVDVELCSTDVGGGCGNELEPAEKRPSLVLKGTEGFFLAPLCAECAQAVKNARYGLKGVVEDEEEAEERVAAAKRLLSYSRIYLGKDASERLTEVSAPKPTPEQVKAERDAAFVSLVERWKALHEMKEFEKGGEKFVVARLAEREGIPLPTPSSKKEGAHYGGAFDDTPASQFGAWGVVRYPSGDWRVVGFTSFELAALLKAGAKDILFNGWLYQPRRGEDVTKELVDGLFREAVIRAAELTKLGEEGVRKAERQARYEARKAGGGNRGNGGGGGGGRGRETEAAPAAPKAAVSDPAPQADPIAIAADADKTRARERHAERKERRSGGEGEGKGRRNERRSDEDGVEFRQEMELEGSRRGKGRKNRGGNEQDDRSWAEHTSAGDGSAKLGDRFGSVLAKVQVAPGPNGQ